MPIVLTQLEHHANIVPWQQLAAERGLEIRWIPLTDDGQLDLADLDRLLDGAKLLGLSAMSNVVGTITPVRHLADAAHAAGALVCLDACQYVPHVRTDVTDLGCDFLAFSGHKMLGPTGIGVLWARLDLLESMPPFLGGGGMILDVHARRVHPRRRAAQVRGRDAADRRDRSASALRSTTSKPWAWMRSAPTRSR